jgi:hypothetical protein
MEILDELTPKIGQILPIIKGKDYIDVDLVEKIFNNFKNHTYNVILEKDRVGIEREAVRKSEVEKQAKPEAKPEELDLSQLTPKERQIKQLETIINKAEAINDKIKLPSNSIIIKARNEARTFLQQIKGGKEDLGRLTKFLRTEVDKVNKKYDSVFKPVAQPIAQVQAQEDEQGQEGFTPTPLLQQGAEEPDTPFDYNPYDYPTYTDFSGLDRYSDSSMGFGKPKKHYKKK